ncbi:MAG TPA: diguanylate cyclase [Steroidobacteraceae bacterium]|jgi:diguanylate cyclase (GGDEF)-like protein|nr:diguanylate cyclase [Steroidobacteraceae bacterium]
MTNATGISRVDLPDSPYARQLRAGFPWLVFVPELESTYRLTVLEEHLPHIRVNLCLAVMGMAGALAVRAGTTGPAMSAIPVILRLVVMIPIVLLLVAVTFSARRHRIYPPLSLAAAILVGLCVAAIQVVGETGAAPLVVPRLELCAICIYFMVGLMFYHALAANLVVMFAYLAAGTLMQLPAREFGFGILSITVANAFCASVAYMHEKTSRLRFLEAALLKELVARDGLTGIQNRRMFDQHIQRVWSQAVRDTQRVAVLLVDIDCFKEYNDRYGHQAGDECLRAVAVSLSQCARRPMDFVARYGGEEFAVILYEASREYVAEVLTRIQRSIAELNIQHEASPVASRLTVSIGAAFVLPGASRTHDGLVQLADEALYGAKEQGRNRVVVLEAEYHSLRTGRFERRGAQRSA